MASTMTIVETSADQRSTESEDGIDEFHEVYPFCPSTLALILPSSSSDRLPDLCNSTAA